MSFVRSANPVWSFVDLTGLELNDQYYIFFLQNTLPYNFQNVWQDPDGINVWSNPIQLLANGTVPNNLYFNPDLVYRIQIRKGPTTADALIYDVQNFIPEGSGNSTAITNFANAQNLITNPQFGDISFANNATVGQNYTITLAGTYDIAPGWQLVLTGLGSTTLLQKQYSGTSFATVPPINGNPPTTLLINNVGWSTAQLIETVADNGAIFSNGSVSMSALLNPSSANQVVSLVYKPSSGLGTIIASSTTTPLPPGVFTTLSGAVNIPASTSADTGNSAFVQFIINLANTGQIEVTNVQVMGQSAQLAVSPAPVAQVPLFQELSPEQIANAEFNVYKNSLITQPKNSILTGWNFALNPFQFVTTGQATATSIAAYIADQTILVQQTASSFTTGQATIPANSLLFLESLTATNNRMALIQYIDPVTIRPYWGDVLSILANVSNTSSNPSSSIRLKARLIWRTTLPSTIGNSEPIASWTVGGEPVFSAGWTSIAPKNDPAYVLPINAVPPLAGMAFDGFRLPPASTANQTLGVVIYTIDNANNVTTDNFLFDKISLVANDFAVEANPQTFDEVLRECQYYYEKSYDWNVLPGATTPSGQLIAQQQIDTDGAGHLTTFARTFGISYKTPKRTTSPTVVFYSPLNVINNVQLIGLNASGVMSINSGVSTANWSQLSGGKSNTVFAKVSTASMNGTGLTATYSYDVSEAYILFHFISDARLGV